MGKHLWFGFSNESQPDSCMNGFGFVQYVVVAVGLEMSGTCIRGSCLASGTVPDMPNIRHKLTIIEHRFGHQSGLHESSGRSWTTFLH